MQLKIFWTVSVFFLLLTSCKNSYELKFDPEEGSKYQVQVITNAITGQETMGQQVKMSAVTEMNLLYETEKIKGDLKDLKISFQNMRTSQNTNGQEIVIDTENPDTSNPGYHMLSAMMGSQFLVTINSMGEVGEVKGMDVMIDKVLAINNPESLKKKEQIEARVKHFMSDEILKNMLEQNLRIFPEGKVQEGDTWKQELFVSQPLPMNIVSSFKLNKVSGTIAHLEVSAVISPVKGGIEMMGMKIDTEMNGIQKGVIEIDAITGMAIRSEITQDIDGKMKVMGQEIPMKVNANIKLKSFKL